MYPWKRTLAWALCALVGSISAVAEEPMLPHAAAVQAETDAGPAGPPDDASDLDVQSASGPSAATGPAPAQPAPGADVPPNPAPSSTELDAQSASGPAAATAEDEGGLPEDLAVDAEALPEATDAAHAIPPPDPDAPLAADATARSLPPFDATATTPPRGAIGYDSEGRQGRIHIVASGDTLWDISDAYLGTPWVWPSIWNDNGEIENPHLIHPGDRIWITPTEMRRISAEEAEALLANVPEAPAEAEPAAPEEPVTLAEEPEPFEAPLSAPAEARSYRVSARESAGLISPEQMTSSASIVGSVPDRVLLSQEDRIYIGLGEAEVEPGDEFTMFRTNEKVFDPDTGALLGYHVDILGWVQVDETFPETSLATIRMSTAEVGTGDRVMPREPLPPEIAVQAAPTGVEGKISFFPGRRVLMGFQDFVYLNRGSLDGIEIGSPLEVYRPGYPAFEEAREEQVEVPDRVIAKLLVVRAETDSSVALVTATEDELELGDRFRGATE